jgi:acyl transferase domain-containing protein
MSTTSETGAGIAINDRQEPIAIVGMSCRFPGDADTPQGFWDLLSQGKDAWSEVPKDRFNIDAYYHPSSDREGAVSYLLYGLNDKVQIQRF